MSSVLRAVTAIPSSTAKEWISVAYMQAIAAQAGLNTKAPNWDTGIDIEVGSDKALYGNVKLPNYYLSFQLKATHDWRISDGVIRFRLDADTYTRLVDPVRIWPIYLVLYTLPRSRPHWIVSKRDYTEFRNKAYYVSLQGQPKLQTLADGTTRTTRTISVPTANCLTAWSLLKLYQQECEKLFGHWGGPC